MLSRLRGVGIYFQLLRVALVVALGSSTAFAEDSLLKDNNGDGTVSFLAFGDSITYGVGDGTQPGEVVTEPNRTDGNEGYPARIRSIAGIRVNNLGVPGEDFSDPGANRLARLMSVDSSDLIGLMEGANDAVTRVTSTEFEWKLQKVINIARALGKKLMLITITPSCCDRAGHEPYTRSYSSVMRILGSVNDIPVADVEHAFATSCQNKDECELLNLPEGLHPNSKGYDVIAQTILATLYGVNIFSPDGAKNLADATGIDESEILVKPDEVSNE